MPQPTIPRGAFGSDGSGLISAGRSIDRAAGALGNIAIQIRREENETESKGLDNKIAASFRDVLFGAAGTAGTPETVTDVDDSGLVISSTPAVAGTPGTIGYLSLKGRDAMTGFEAAEGALRKALADIQGSSSNEAVNRIVGNMGEARLTRELRAMQAHMAEQRTIYHNEVGASRESNAAEDAAMAWHDDGVTVRSLSLIEHEVHAFAERNGLSPEA
ncbi:MAG: hypothetical protein QGF59_07160, partial [Pirellulaceae bacterium]|nr:hypothetical protein [Pirellulaceae bacterium]